MAKGADSKEKVKQKILEIFEGSFVNDKEIRIPLACIYDVKHLKEFGTDYNHDKMIKIK